jgi:hypothetical protein
MMSAKTVAVGLVAAGCITAAGVGGYLAARGGSASPAAAPAATSTGPAAPGVPSAEPATVVAPAKAPAAAGVENSQSRPAERTQPVRNSGPAATNPQTATPERTEPRAAPAEVKTSEPPDMATVEPRGGSLPVASPAAETNAGAPNAAVVAEEPPALLPEPPTPTFEELTVAENGVIGIRLETPVSSDTAKVEDRITARITRDVTVDGRVAVPAGATIEGIVTLVERGGRFRERARLGVEFTTVVLADNARVSIETEPIYRTGEAPGGEATAKIGAGAVLGSILGAVIGGKKGAAIGGSAGAAGGTAAVMASGPNHVMLVSGTPLTVRLTEPATFRVPIEP